MNVARLFCDAMELCLNCSAPLTGMFCAACGQRTETHRLDWHWLWHEAQHTLLHVDKGILYTLKGLFVHPGHTIREFLQGKRVKHFKPLALVTVLAAIYSFGYFMAKPDISTLPMDAPTKESYDRMVGVVMGYYAVFEMGSIPVFAFWSWLLMRGYGHNYVEHLVINTFLAGQRIAINIIGLPFNFISFEAGLLYASIAYMVYWGYYLFGFGQLYGGEKGAGAVFRALFAFILFWVVVFTVIIVATIVMMIGQAKASVPAV